MKSRGGGVDKNIDKNIYDDISDGLNRYRDGILIVASIIICYVAISSIVIDVNYHSGLDKMSMVAPDTIGAMDEIAIIAHNEKINIPPKDAPLSDTLAPKAHDANLPDGDLVSISNVDTNLVNVATPLSARKLFILGLPFDINTATAQDLAMISGIGEKISGWIIDYRDVHGPFFNIDDLKKVKGIGEYRASLIGKHVKFGGGGD